MNISSLEHILCIIPKFSGIMPSHNYKRMLSYQCFVRWPTLHWWMVQAWVKGMHQSLCSLVHGIPGGKYIGSEQGMWPSLELLQDEGYHSQK